MKKKIYTIHLVVYINKYTNAKQIPSKYASVIRQKNIDKIPTIIGILASPDARNVAGKIA
jgi:hypothetical protein